MHHHPGRPVVEDSRPAEAVRPRARRVSRAAWFGAAALLAACGESAPTTPTPVAGSTVLLSGSVADVSARPVPRVDVVAVGQGDGAGYGAATTDDTGRFRLSLDVPPGTWLSVHFSRSGYLTATATVRAGASDEVEVTLVADESTAGLDRLQGSWLGDRTVLVLDGTGARCAESVWPVGTTARISARLDRHELVVSDPDSGALCRLALRVEAGRVVGHSFDLLDASSCHYRVAADDARCSAGEAWIQAASLDAATAGPTRIEGTLRLEVEVPLGGAWLPMAVTARVGLSRASADERARVPEQAHPGAVLAPAAGVP